VASVQHRCSAGLRTCDVVWIAVRRKYDRIFVPKPGFLRIDDRTKSGTMDGVLQASSCSMGSRKEEHVNSSCPDSS
jgi:hypothetical protein